MHGQDLAFTEHQAALLPSRNVDGGDRPSRNGLQFKSLPLRHAINDFHDLDADFRACHTFCRNRHFGGF